MENVINHPNPQIQRENWQSLNCEWDFGFKKAVPGYEFTKDEASALKLYKKAVCTEKIKVPYCIESKMSGIGYTGFVNMVWYRKKVKIRKSNDLIFLHIGAADYLTTVFINGSCAGRHKGGYTSFAFEISDFVVDGNNEIFILCEDKTKSPFVPSGKQSDRKNSYACSYTRTTGIWQSVYLEYTPKEYVKSFKIFPDYQNSSVTVEFDLCGKADLTCTALYNNVNQGKAEIKNASGKQSVKLNLKEKYPWEIGNGKLYDLEIHFGNDKVKSYFGLRNVELQGYKFLLNGKSVFQRLVLDQGFYRDGIYTAEDKDFVNDINLSVDLGFNGARLHQKVFDPRFLYFCDKKGYMVWGEYASWGIDYSKAEIKDIFLSEWKEAVERDFNHPSIVVWCPFNETWNYRGRRQNNGLLISVYEQTKALDPTRPCIDTSGNFHTDKTDIYDLHDYRYDPDEFKKEFDRFVTEDKLYEHVLLDNPGRQCYKGGPVSISEYGGIKWSADSKYKSWGYGEDVKTEDEFAQRYCGLTEAIIDNEKILGFCYTQLYDVEQEQNGLYTYDRERKFSESTYKKIAESNKKTAAIEKD